MTDTPADAPAPLLSGLDKSEYDVRTLDDEIRVDRLCVDLLRHLYGDLTRRAGLPAEQAGALCQGADYYLREFIVGDRGDNLFDAGGGRVRQFAGHWYIIRTAEPNLTELSGILAGTAELYRFLARQGLVAPETAEAIAGRCADLDYYRQRIDDFWAIEGGGYDAWRRACPLEPVADRP